jgi:hypothetical protein
MGGRQIAFSFDSYPAAFYIAGQLNPNQLNASVHPRVSQQPDHETASAFPELN